MHDTTPGDRPPPEERTHTVEPVQPEAETVLQVASRGSRAAVVPFSLGRYRVTERLGVGGFGTVYKGHDEALEREVAVKVFHPQFVASPDELTADWAEGRALASLDHPGIVPVYDVGRTDDGLCYLVSKFIAGGDLSRQLRRERPTRAETVALVIAVAEALHYAHQRGLVHRDIKPANILLDTDGRPYVVDFGQALREEEYGTGPTFTGTPSYMSPEQARGEGHRVNARTDVYSLGVVLYELLTGQVPFLARDREDLLEQIKTRPPRPPRQVDSTIPRELERICLKALRKRAAERYETAQAMANDLRHFEGFLQEMRTQRPALENASTATWAPPEAGVEPEPRQGSIMPKGLRSFDAGDADFFLDLLPGPRDRNGLPESIRFWKKRIEAADMDEPFRVGVLYGPSGCGKSSLVKAGLLPRLTENVIPVYVEATPDDLEARLLNGLRRRCPNLPASLGLAESLASLRRGLGARSDRIHAVGGEAAPMNRGTTNGPKVLLVLDQFEQWLHAHGEASPAGLVEALRQCDGGHVQALLLVRDDFWLAVSRFMRDLEVPLVEGRNTALVDLFDPPHARAVLAEFGCAFGRLPAHPAEPTPEQERFLDEAVTGLARDGKIIPVRLSLFAEMVRGKPWTPTTLHAVGGTEGIGVLFLEESLGDRAARPGHRLHQEAARAVLRALLPERGTNLKGAMRSREELLAAAGLARQPGEFSTLLHVLDDELRLVTPTEPAGLPNDVQQESCEAPAAGTQYSVLSTQYYQLTHDYLVPALREWLTRKQRETRRGRAELCLNERADLWIARPERRHLPSGREWLRILLFTQKRDWTGAQGKMMRAATRRYGLRLVLTVLLLGLLGWGAWEGWGYLGAATLVHVLEAANTADAPETIRDLDGYRRWANPMLRRLAADSAPDSRERLHASLALLPADDGQIDYLVERLLKAGPQEVAVIRDALRPHRPQVVPRLWGVLASETAGPVAHFNAGVALAGLDSPDEAEAAARWQRQASFLVAYFLRVARADPSSYAVLVEALRPVRLQLLDALGAVFRDRGRPEYDRLLTTTLLADYAADQPKVLADLLLDADAEQYAVLLPKLKPYDTEAAAAMSAELAREARAAMPDREKEALAKRQANAAVTLLHLGRPEPVWPLFQHGEDPRLRSRLIHRLQPLGADPEPVAQRLLAEPDVTIRRALILSLGEYPAASLADSTRERVAEQLLRWYRDDPDPGIHSAVEWLFRGWGVDARLKPVNQELASMDPIGERRWYVNRQGQTFAVIPGPVTVAMGSPTSEADRDNEPIVRREIGRSFAVATTPVTLAQFQRFLRAKKWTHTYTRKYCPEANCPVTGINWFMAAQYCRWLSEEEGILEDQRCFPAVDDLKEGVQLPADYLSRTGYRLLTEAEWEYACRAGAVTSRYFGSSEELLVHYGWYNGNSRVRTHPVGSLKPNDFGLFDMHGNIWQWCQERALASRPWSGKPAPLEDREDTDPVAEMHGRVLRGGAFYDHPSFLRSAARLSNRPYMIDDYFGFRVARTIR